MNATEVIEEIKRLPQEERAKVIAFVASQQSESAEGRPRVRHADAVTFEKAAEKVFREHDELFRRLAQ